jgi:hypothetical protein
MGRLTITVSATSPVGANCVQVMWITLTRLSETRRLLVSGWIQYTGEMGIAAISTSDRTQTETYLLRLNKHVS